MLNDLLTDLRTVPITCRENFSSVLRANGFKNLLSNGD